MGRKTVPKTRFYSCSIVPDRFVYVLDEGKAGGYKVILRTLLHQKTLVKKMVCNELLFPFCFC